MRRPEVAPALLALSLLGPPGLARQLGIGRGHLAPVGAIDATGCLSLRAGPEVVLPGSWLGNRGSNLESAACTIAEEERS
jgi:hypothetical protein